MSAWEGVCVFFLEVVDGGGWPTKRRGEEREERRWVRLRSRKGEDEDTSIEDTRREEGVVRRNPFRSVILGQESAVASLRRSTISARKGCLSSRSGWRDGPWHRHLPSPMARASCVHGRTRHNEARVGTFLITRREGPTTQTNAIFPIVAKERSDEGHHSSSVMDNIFFVLFFPFPAEDSPSSPLPSSSPRVPFPLRRGRAGVRLESHRPGPIPPSYGTVSVSVRN